MTIEEQRAKECLEELESSSNPILPLMGWVDWEIERQLLEPSDDKS